MLTIYRRCFELVITAITVIDSARLNRRCSMLKVQRVEIYSKIRKTLWAESVCKYYFGKFLSASNQVSRLTYTMRLIDHQVTSYYVEQFKFWLGDMPAKINISCLQYLPLVNISELWNYHQSIYCTIIKFRMTHFWKSKFIYSRPNCSPKYLEEVFSSHSNLGIATFVSQRSNLIIGRIDSMISKLRKLFMLY